MGNPETKKGKFTKDGEMIISPKKYEPNTNEPTFTFKNFYIEYGRFHADEMNTLIHVIFIPLIVITIYGLAYNSESLGNITFDLSKGFMPSIGRFEGPTSDTVYTIEFVLALWAVVTFVYCICDPVIGVTAFLFFNACFYVLRNLIERDLSDEKLFGGNIRTYILYVHLISWVC